MANTRFINEGGVVPDIHDSAVIDGIIDCIHKVTIEKDVFSGHDVMILTGGHDIYKFGEERKASNGGGPVTIHEGVWIASRAMIIGPAEIGKHAVIGAGAVVKGDVPAYALMIGNPAQNYKMLNI
jgi:acetyltransferase-like isoleucine patch superfamily enzyme